MAWAEGKLLIEMVLLDDGSWYVRLHAPGNQAVGREDYLRAKAVLEPLGVSVPVYAPVPEDMARARPLLDRYLD